MRLPSINYQASVQQRGRLPVRQPRSTMLTALAQVGMAAADEYDKWYEQEAKTELAGAVLKAKRHAMELFEEARQPGLVDATTLPEGVGGDMARTDEEFDGSDTVKVPRMVPRYEVAHEVFEREAQGFINAMAANIQNDRARQMFLARGAELYMPGYQDLLRAGYEQRREAQAAELDLLIDDRLTAGDEQGARAALKSAHESGIFNRAEYTSRSREIGNEIDKRFYNRALMNAETQGHLDVIEDYISVGKVRGRDGQVRDSRLSEDEQWQIRRRIETRRNELYQEEKRAKQEVFGQYAAAALTGQMSRSQVAQLLATGQLDPASAIQLTSMLNSNEARYHAAIARQEAAQDRADRRARQAQADEARRAKAEQDAIKAHFKARLQLVSRQAPGSELTANEMYDGIVAEATELERGFSTVESLEDVAFVYQGEAVRPTEDTLQEIVAFADMVRGRQSPEVKTAKRQIQVLSGVSTGVNGMIMGDEANKHSYLAFMSALDRFADREGPNGDYDKFIRDNRARFDPKAWTKDRVEGFLLRYPRYSVTVAKQDPSAPGGAIPAQLEDIPTLLSWIARDLRNGDITEAEAEKRYVDLTGDPILPSGVAELLDALEQTKE